MFNILKNEIVFFFKRNKEFAIEEHFKKEAGDFTLVLFSLLSWKESLLSSHNILSLCFFNIMINEFAFYFIHGRRPGTGRGASPRVLDTVFGPLNWGL